MLTSVPLASVDCVLLGKISIFGGHTHWHKKRGDPDNFTGLTSDLITEFTTTFSLCFDQFDRSILG